jgi:methionine--tRNA ligase beta chain
MVNFKDFQNLDLRVATIKKAEPVKGSDKLLKLEVDLGSEHRQLVAGIAQDYNYKDLAGRQIVVIANLEPKIVFGLESQGMLLAASCQGQPVLLRPDQPVAPGAKIS